MTKIQKILFENQDLKYRDFHSKLMPTVEKEKIIGVRIPILRSLAKDLYKTEPLLSHPVCDILLQQPCEINPPL